MAKENHMDKHGEYCSRLIHYRIELDEYSIPDYVHYPADDSAPKQSVYFCPWCGERLPDSRRKEWYKQLKALGIDPHFDEIPPKYKTDEWRK